MLLTKISLIVSFLCLSEITLAGELGSKFEKLAEQAAADPQARIEALLRPYGQMADFKIVEEVTSSEECTRETKIRSKTTCEKKSIVTRKQYFAEGKGLLCKVDVSPSSIDCLIKK